MSRRIPLSKASRFVETMTELYPAARWDRLPPAVRSDEEELRDAAANAMLADPEIVTALANRDRDPVGWCAVMSQPRFPTPADFALIRRWQCSPHVYDFDPELSAALGESPSGDLPLAALGSLPYPIQYVRGCGFGYDGFFAWLDHDPEPPFGDCLMLSFLERDGITRSPYVIPMDREMTVEGFVDLTRRQDEVYDARLAGVGIEGHTKNVPDAPEGLDPYESLALLISQAVSMLCYVVSQDADVGITYEPPQVNRGQRTGRKTNPETRHSVGARVGRALGEASRSRGAGARAPSEGSGSKSPHVRRGHWSHYWVGKRKGRDDGRRGDAVVVRWIPPLAINGGGGGEVVHDARVGEPARPIGDGPR